MKSVCSLICGILCATIACADILELTDGKLLNGKYMGGTAGTIRFEAAGRLAVYPIGSVLALTISRPQDSGPTQSNLAPPASSRTAGQATGSHVVPASTDVLIKLRSEISTASAGSGQKFDATLESDLRAGSVIVAPKGSIVKGTVTEVRRPRRIVKVAILGLTLDEVVVGAQSIRLSTKPLRMETRPDGSIIRGAVAGAIIGEVVDNDSGHGAAAGASLGALKRGDDIAYPAGSILKFMLSSPIRVSR